MSSIRVIRLVALVGCALSPGCDTKRAADYGACRPLATAQGPFAKPVADAKSPPRIWLIAERDVILLGQTPSIDVDAESADDEFRETRDFELSDANGRVAASECDPKRKPSETQAFATLSFECVHPKHEGVYNVRVDPARLGFNEPATSLALRVLATLPETAPAPVGWVAEPLARGLPEACGTFRGGYHVRLEGGELKLEPRIERAPADIPAALMPRLSESHARVVTHVFEAGDGWLVMFDHGEFGGGVEWFAKAGGEPRPIRIGPSRADRSTPQNVTQAMAIGGVVFVLQGLSHMSQSPGQLGALWREHDHFTSRVVASFRLKPVDWLRQSDNTWLVLTADGIFRTSEAGEVALVARLPQIAWNPSSLVRTPDGRIYVGSHNGVLRLTPRWTEAPEFVTDFLMPEGSEQQQCWAKAFAR